MKRRRYPAKTEANDITAGYVLIKIITLTLGHCLPTIWPFLEDKTMAAQRISIFDTTLRDCDIPGCSMTLTKR